ncbi:DUF397 domain-containing protein [Streptomyces acidicola]|uniref:DUF397 domain-containing protein n=1 Tax=Streptomyces acidicola TaxID=2596892 RepID=UPI003813746C
MTTAAQWQKSSFSGGGEGNDCIELTSASATIHLRESDTPHTGVTTAPIPLAHLLHGIRTGRLGAGTPRCD